MQKIICITLVVCSFCCCMAGCNESNEKKQTTKPEKKTNKIKKPANVATTLSYHFLKPSKWLQSAASRQSKNRSIVLAVNRADSSYLKKMDAILIPSDFSGDVAAYLPFPFEVPFFKDISKLILFSYPTQSFGAYEYGSLVYAGPTSMGRKKDPTPTGLFFTNWKAEESTSTFDDEWNLRWNFNIENKLGVGWHQYAMPGYPASHSCLRLLEEDAKYLYTWADQWKLSKKDTVILKGTPVIVFGSYDFAASKPWLELANHPDALRISVDDLERIVKPFYNEIIHWQLQRESIETAGIKNAAH